MYLKITVKSVPREMDPKKPLNDVYEINWEKFGENCLEFGFSLTIHREK